MTVSDGVSPSPKGRGGWSRLGPPLNPPLAIVWAAVRRHVTAKHWALLCVELCYYHTGLIFIGL